MHTMPARELSERGGQRVATTDFNIPVGADDEESCPAELAGDELQQQQRGHVCPVQVVQHEQQRLVGRCVRRKVAMPSKRRKRACSPSTVAVFGRSGSRSRTSGTIWAMSAAPVRVRNGAVRVARVDVTADDLHPRPIGRRSFPLVAPPPENLRATQAGVGRGLLGKGRLADPGSPASRDDRQTARRARHRRQPVVGRLMLTANEDAAGKRSSGFASCV